MKSSLSLLLLIIVFLTGCGGGSTTTEETSESDLSENEIDAQVVAEDTVASNDAPNSVDLISTVSTSTEEVSESGSTENEIDTQTVAGNSVASNDEPNSVDSISMGQDPLFQSTIPVTFDITVPAYQSGELRIDLVWGEISLTAMWVGDEYWSAVGDFPTESEDNLTVTFYDRDGDIKLASISQALKTGSNAKEPFQVLLDQFDANQFDADGDGINNLDELIAGTDPLVDESTLLEIRDTISLPSDILPASQQLEVRLSEQRPYIESQSEFIPISEDEDAPGTLVSTNIDIDADGNGTMSFSSRSPWYNDSHSGTRTNSGNSIMWEGSYLSNDGDYRRTIKFTNEVTIVDENTRDFIQEINEVYSGAYRDTWEISSNLTGKLIEGTSLCKFVSGTISRTHGTNRNGFLFKTATTTVSKEVDDQYWKVVYVNESSEALEYLARELRLSGSGADDRDFPTFKCVFVDL